MGKGMAGLAKSFKILEDYKNPTEDATTYWRIENELCLLKMKEKLEVQLEEVERLIDKNDQVETFYDAMSVATDLNRLK